MENTIKINEVVKGRLAYLERNLIKYKKSSSRYSFGYNQISEWETELRTIHWVLKHTT